MKTMTMTTAVLLAIKSFGTTPFSIYNITAEIRDNVNSSRYELAIFEDDVNHEDVKEHFQELVDNGLLDDYYTNYNPAGYREFCTVDPTLSNPVASVNIPAAVANTTIPTDIQLKIYKYLKNRGPATMKQIQSRLKGQPYTCKDIYDLLNNIGLIDPNSSQYDSTSQKFTVAI